jgi:hypothetical protein
MKLVLGLQEIIEAKYLTCCLLPTLYQRILIHHAGSEA